MATSPGWGTLGATIAGGNAVNRATAFEQGESLSAKTADALEQARARINENNAREQLGNTLQALEPDPGKRQALVGLLQAKVNPAEVANYNKTQQEVGFRNDIVSPTTSDTDVARRALALNQKPIISSLGEGQVINELHPVTDTGAPNVVTTDIGHAIAGQHNAAASNQNAEAALHKDQVVNPQKYRVGLAPPPIAGGAYDGSTPHPQNEDTAQLIASGQYAAPTAGSPAFFKLGGNDFMKRVNFLAGQQGGATPPAAGGPPAAPGAPAAPKPFQANFNANTFAVNKTTANDFARSTGTGGKLDSVNRIAGHLGVLEDLYNKLDNGNFQPTNQFINYFKQLTGKQYPGSAQLAGQMIGTEIVKSMTQVGAGSADERLNIADAFGAKGTREGQKTAITTAQQLVAEQAKDLAMRGARGGLKGIYEPGRYFTPEAIKRYGLVDPAAAPPVAAPPAAGGGVSDDDLIARYAGKK